MKIFDKLLGLRLVENLTETTLWADAIFSGLEQDRTDEHGIEFEDAVAETEPSARQRYQ